jgi:hypothetical protein
VIRYALTCKRGHVFESWFGSSKAYDEQVARGLISCPACGSTEVEKSLMTPAVGKASRRPRQEITSETTGEQKSPVALLSEKERELRTKLREIRDHVTKNADYVGGKFPEEARRMHYGEIEHRSIYGEASPQDAAALIDEGIEVQPLPIIPDERN